MTIENTEEGDIIHIWTMTKWKKFYPQSTVIRYGLRFRFEKEVDAEVKRACKEFGSWLRKNYYFPIRVTIYFKASEYILAYDGDCVSATFFEPYKRSDEPYIRIATGDYREILNRRGKDDALAAILRTIAHELTHYFQWINDLKLTETGLEHQAKMYAGYVVDEYAETREHP